MILDSPVYHVNLRVEFSLRRRADLRYRTLNQFSPVDHILNEKHDRLSVPDHIYRSVTITMASYDSYDSVFGDSRGALGTESLSLQAVGFAGSHFAVLPSTRDGRGRRCS
jgi:hypothetical protein